MAAAPVVVVGCGPVGMTLALQLARFDVPSVILDRKPELERVGSRAIVLAKHALEIFRQVGAGDEMLARGVLLRRARTYYRGLELFAVDFPEPAPDEVPRFINLQQVHTERALYEQVERNPLIDVRWNTEVDSLDFGESFVVGCDGARSTVRKLLGVEFAGRSFHDRFLIADIRADLPFPNERRFFFSPPWNPGRTVLIHPQPDSEWRIDWQVPPETDAEEERSSGRLDGRIREIVGDRPYELAWLTGYRFHERCATRFRVGNVFLAGDAAHLVAPFGARGLNSGVEDAANLAWKLAAAIRGEAADDLLDTYESERMAAARENIRVTSATMRFMAPPNPVRRAVRNAILRGSLHAKPLRRFVNSGQLAERSVYPGVGPYVGNDEPRFVERDGTVVRPDGYVVQEESP